MVAVAGLVASLALVNVNATAVIDVSKDAQIQQAAESAMSATAAARNALGQALLIAGTTADPALVTTSVEQTHIALEALRDRMERLAGLAAEPPDTSMLEVAAVTDQTLTAIESGDLDGASDLAVGDIVDVYDTLMGDLGGIRATAAGNIQTAADNSSATATATRFMVALLLPAFATAVGLAAIRRRRRRLVLEAELMAERAINHSKNQLIANLSHELRTPLTGIYTAALTMDDSDSEDFDLTRELTGMIIDQAADLTRMVEDLLVSAQVDAGRLAFTCRDLPIAEHIHSTVAEFKRAAPAITVSTEPATVAIDPGRFRQVLRNLVSNAIRYGDGDITVEGHMTGDSYVVSVTDNGPGVPPDMEPRLFERFVHRDDTPLIVGSVGLGLAISQVLAHEMGGTVSYARADGRTRFTVTLPLSLQAPGTQELHLDMPPDPLPAEPPALFDDDRNRIGSVASLGLADRVTTVLSTAEIETTGQLTSMTRADLLEIPGIGPARLAAVETALAASGLALDS